MKKPYLPPRWAIKTIWSGHRQLFRLSGGRLGLRLPTGELAGMLRLHTVGRKSGQPREVILCYVRDGERLATLAMNGWSEPDPQWWLNLQAHPEAEIETVTGRFRIRAREATGAEREKAWGLIGDVRGWANDLDAMASLRNRETTVVLLEPIGSQPPIG